MIDRGATREKIRQIGTAICCAVICCQAGLAADGSISSSTLSNLDKEIQAVLPTSKEDQWQQIPWRRNLMQARMEAQQLHRPIFVWVMNGNPFGCT